MTILYETVEQLFVLFDPGIPAQLQTKIPRHKKPTDDLTNSTIYIQSSSNVLSSVEVIRTDSPLSTNPLTFDSADLPRRGPFPVREESQAPLRHTDQLLQGVSAGGVSTAAG